MEINATPIRVVFWGRQPFVARGLAEVLHERPEFHLIDCCEDLALLLQALRSSPADLVLIYLTSRVSLSDIRAIRASAGRAQVVLWGDGLGGEFALQAMQMGVRGILGSGMPVENLLAALENVHRGVLCFEKDLMEAAICQTRVALTRRQGQIVSLVAQGFKNKEIACAMGITEGTVKVYLYKLFRKLGMNDRLDMALYGLKNLFVDRQGAPDPFGPRSLPPQARDRCDVPALN